MNIIIISRSTVLGAASSHALKSPVAASSFICFCFFSYLSSPFPLTMPGIATNSSAIAIGFCLPIIGGVLVALRFYTRWHQNTNLYVDDWLCLPAWVRCDDPGAACDASIRTEPVCVALRDGLLCLAPDRYVLGPIAIVNVCFSELTTEPDEQASSRLPSSMPP